MSIDVLRSTQKHPLNLVYLSESFKFLWSCTGFQKEHGKLNPSLGKQTANYALFAIDCVELFKKLPDKAWDEPGRL